MKQQLIILGLILIFIFVGLSGCTDEKSSNEVQLVSHKIETKNGTISGNNKNITGEYKEVSGTIKNLANRYFDKVTITVSFLDRNNTNLKIGVTTVLDFGIGASRSFKVDYNELEPYYTQYDHYTIKITT